MHFQVNKKYVLMIIITTICACDDSSIYFLLESVESKSLVPIPNHPNLNNEVLVSLERNKIKLEDILVLSKFSEVKFAIESKNISLNGKEITIINPPLNFQAYNYLQFHYWLNTNFLNLKFESDFFKNILHYLDYFDCNDKEMIFKLFHDIDYHSIDKEESLKTFFTELKSYPKLSDFFKGDSEEKIEVSFQKSYYLFKLESILVANTFEIKKSAPSGFYSIFLKQKNSKSRDPKIRIIKFDMYDKYKLMICVDFKIINDAIKKRMIFYEQDMLETISFNTYLKIFRTLEYLATEDKLEANICVKGNLSYINLEIEHFSVIDSDLHLCIFTELCKHEVYTLNVNLISNICAAKAILNALFSPECSELFLTSSICKIKTENEFENLLILAFYITKIDIPNKNGFKLIKTNYKCENICPIFSGVILVGGLNNKEKEEEYIKYSLDVFWGAIIK